METNESLRPTPRPVVGEEHLVAVGSAAALSILRDMSLEAGLDGRVGDEEATAAAITYGRLAAAVGGVAEAMAIATLLRREADLARAASAFPAVRALLGRAAIYLRAAADHGDAEAAAQLAGVLADPLYNAFDDAETRLEVNALDLIRSGATGDVQALETMIRGTLLRFDTLPLKSLVEAEQYARLAAPLDGVSSALLLSGVLFLRALWEDREGGNADRLIDCAVEAVSIAHEYAAAGDATARDAAAHMVERLQADALVAVAELFPSVLAYCPTGGAC